MKWKAVAFAVVLSAGVSTTTSAHDTDEMLTDLRRVYDECVRCCVSWEENDSVIHLDENTCQSLCKEFAVDALKISVGIEGLINNIYSF